MSAVRFRPLTEADVEFSVRCEATDLEIEGNAMASGDDATDQACCDWIRSELDSGNQWAWCDVTVTAHWDEFEGTSDWLGGCSYTGEEQFREPGGYFDDMKREALLRLNQRLANAAIVLLEVSP